VIARVVGKGIRRKDVTMTDPSATVPSVAPPGPAAAQATPSGDRLRRLIVPIAWEAILLLATMIAVAVLMLGERQPPFSLVLAALTPIGLLAVAVAVSLRTATVNLAVGALAVLAATVGVALSNNDMALVPAMALGVVVATLAGLMLGVVAGALSVPSWAVTLGGATIIEAAVIGAGNNRITPLREAVGPLSGLWFVLFVLLTLGGAALWLVPGVRTWLSATRDVTPAGRWGGLRPVVGAVAGLTVSGFVAGIAGVVYALRVHTAPTGSGSSLTMLGLAVALLGGVSVFGRRAGVAGVLLATILLGSVQQILLINGVRSWVVTLVTGIAVLIGLAATRLTESVIGQEKP
jgi:ribose/xylose/arabinose/galactoside ABC-type transport system permease subunit